VKSWELIPFACLHVRGQLAHAQLFYPEFFNGSTLAPIVCVMKYTAEADDAADAVDRDAITFTDRSNWHQAHGQFFKDVSVIQSWGCLDPIISSLVMHGFIQVFSTRIISQLEPFHHRARPSSNC